jgi:TIR domain
MTIFISYRREDSSHFAGRLYDSIREAVPDAGVFMDVTSISFGEDFADVLSDRLKSCEAALVIIGPKWLEPVGDTGKTKLDDQDDYIRLEIETALDRKIPLIPVLVDGAQMPGENQIPEKLRALRRRQFVKIDHDNYTPVVKHLVSQLSRLVQAGPLQLAEVAPPQSEVPTHPAPTAKRKRNAVVIGALALFVGFSTQLGEPTLWDLRPLWTNFLLSWAVIVGGLALAFFVWRRV